MRRNVRRYARTALVGFATPWLTGCSESAPVAAPVVEEAPPAPPPPLPNSPNSPPNPTPSETGHIYVADVSGAVLTRIIAGSRPAWSPDGQRIAFQVGSDIHVANADGTAPVRLRAGAHPAWSPDGARIAFTSSEGISIMNADGSNVRTLVPHDFRDATYTPDLGVGKPSWSPHGLIAFEHHGDGDIAPAQIYVVGTDGSSPRRLSSYPNGARFAESDPAWSPDGSRVVFWSYVHGISVAARAGGVPKGLYSNFPAVAYGAKPVFSPDGTSILFNSARHEASGRAVWIMSSDGRGVQQFIPDAYDPVWSPDGKRVAFVSTRGG